MITAIDNRSMMYGVRARMAKFSELNSNLVLGSMPIYMDAHDRSTAKCRLAAIISEEKKIIRFTLADFGVLKSPCGSEEIGVKSTERL